jgi:hypothetical protein
VKRIIVIIGLALALAAPVLPAEADDRPDFKLKCRNGRYDAKVWLAPFKVENKCATRTSSQWVEVVYQQGDEDVYVWNVASGATHKPGQILGRDSAEKVYVRLGTGVFCYEDTDVHYVDTNGITTVYPKGSTWRATCDPEAARGRGYNVVVSN